MRPRTGSEMPTAGVPMCRNTLTNRSAVEGTAAGFTPLLNVLVAQGYVNAYAGIALPNLASVRLHEALGFTPVGIFHGVGFKHETWWDVGWWRRRLVDPPRAPHEPLPWSQLSDQTVDSALAAYTG